MQSTSQHFSNIFSPHLKRPFQYDIKEEDYQMEGASGERPHSKSSRKLTAKGRKQVVVRDKLPKQRRKLSFSQKKKPEKLNFRTNEDIQHMGQDNPPKRKSKNKEFQSGKLDQRNKALKNLLKLTKRDLTKNPSDNFRINFVEEKK